MSLMLLRIKRFKVTHSVHNKNRIRQISRQYLATYPMLLTEHHLVQMERSRRSFEKHVGMGDEWN
jgi:hypothetical protein